MSRHTPTAAEQLHYDLSNLAQFIANVLEALESHEGYSVGDSYDDTMTLEELASDLRAAFIAYTEHDPDSDAAAAALAQYVATETAAAQRRPWDDLGAAT
jgi:hypothetical protein